MEAEADPLKFKITVYAILRLRGVADRKEMKGKLML